MGIMHQTDSDFYLFSTNSPAMLVGSPGGQKRLYNRSAGQMQADKEGVRPEKEKEKEPAGPSVIHWLRD